MLPVPLDRIDEALLRRVCDEGWTESHHLDFKAKTYESTPEGRSELRKDVCAFANADGGDLVIGISEKSGKANSIHPYDQPNPDLEIRRLVGCLDNELEPRLHGVRARAIQVTGGHVLVLRIPRSFSGPHRIGQASGHRFVARNNTQTSDMTYDQVRNAFLLGSTVADKATSFARERVDQLSAGHTIKPMARKAQVAVHLIPFQGIAGRFTLHIPTTRLDAEIAPVFDGNAQRRPNLQGIVFYPFEERGLVEQYLQVFRNGCVEHVRTVAWSDQGGGGYIVAEWAARYVSDTLSAYKKMAKTWEIGGPVLIAVTAVHTSGLDLICRERNIFKFQAAYPHIGLGEHIVDDISMDLEADAISQQFMDVLFQASGQPRCPLYDEDGHLKISGR